MNYLNVEAIKAAFGAGAVVGFVIGLLIGIVVL